MFEYASKMIRHLELLAKDQAHNISRAAEWFAEVIVSDHILHTFGSGHSHMIGLELFVRAGGLANTNAIDRKSVV